ncbi:TPA: hypothetical protein F8R88_15400, partial [Legionella pneumophila]|nr:hypothetical protein [Legionella pneumophila]
MYKKQTTFVLGAGASYYYGYPLGEDLVRQICNDIDDNILLFESDPNKYFYNNNDLANGRLYELDDFISAFNNRSIEIFKTHEEFFSVYSGNTYHNIFTDANSLFETRISSIKEFRDLQNALISFTPPSIDIFLRDNPTLDRAGRIMILYTLLKCEDKKKFELTYKPDEDKISDNWYPLLLNEIASQCSLEPENLLENKLSIITFNYDLSLEYFLHSRLKSTEIFNKPYKGQNNNQTISEKFLSEKLNIHHVYGALYTKEFLCDYGNYSNTSISGHNVHSVGKQLIYRFKRFARAIDCYQNIETMFKARDERSTLNAKDFTKIFRDSEEIIFIGFGFDRDNLNRIGLPDTIKGYQELFKGKEVTIRYLNFANKMKSLAEE